MPPQFRRYLPLVLIVFLALIVLPRLIHRHTSGLSKSEKATRTVDAMNLIDAGEQRFRAAHGRFTGHLADLLSAKSKLADDLAIGLGVQLDVSTDGQTFYVQVAGDVLSLVRARTGGRLNAESCVILKSGSHPLRSSLHTPRSRKPRTPVRGFRVAVRVCAPSGICR